MKTNLICLKVFTAFFALAALGGCVKEGTGAEGTAVRFGVSTVYENGPSTKTEYSGLDENGSSITSSSMYERIDWLDSDEIKIACDKATLVSGSGNASEYSIIGGTVNSRYHYASISPKDGNGLQWGTGNHDFYAMYPSSTQNSNATIAVAASGATVSGSIPAAQSATLSGYIFKPDMDYAYMYAVAAGVTPGSEVNLDFYPLVTTLEFTLLTKAGDAITSNLTSVVLSSANNTLTGSFSAPLTAGGLGAVSTSGEGNAITITLPGGGVQLSTNPAEAYTFTFLTLPVAQTSLTLTLNFADSSKRTLDLKDAGDWITVLACKKAYIWRLDAPKTVDTFTYTLTASTNSINLLQSGAAQNYTITSYKTGSITSRQIAEPWTAEFSTDGGSTWSPDAPAWLNVTAGGDGSVTATTYSAGALGNDASQVWPGVTTEIESSKASARDLSMYDIYGALNAAGRTTANCYVVSQPGWYCLPAVYGNAIKNGADNTNAYRKGAADAASVMGAFKNHTGNGITAPWIKDNGITISSAELLWQDVQYLISDVEFSGDYIYFHVDPDHIGQGNAVIAAKASGAIVWSWHIWVMDNPFTKLATQSIYSYSSIPSIVEPNYMLSMNLGFCEASIPERSVKVRISQDSSSETAEITITQSGAEFNNPYYQWGRKDPMYPSDGIYGDPGRQKAVFDASGNSIAALNTGSATTVGNSILNPDTFYYTSSLRDWSTVRYDNLWNYLQTVPAPLGARVADIRVGKTVYDPCPPGFSVPNENAFTGFSPTGSNSEGSSSGVINAANANPPSNLYTDYGYYFYVNPSATGVGTIFFPATGWIDGGVWGEIGMRGRYWTGTPYLRSDNRVCGVNLAFGNSDPVLKPGIFYVNPRSEYYRSLGASVRPIKEHE